MEATLDSTDARLTEEICWSDALIPDPKNE